jgi:hypothetical protein
MPTAPKGTPFGLTGNPGGHVSSIENPDSNTNPEEPT